MGREEESGMQETRDKRPHQTGGESRRERGSEDVAAEGSERTSRIEWEVLGGTRSRGK